VTLGSHRIPEFGTGEGHVVADRYELAGELGSGAGTVVFLARDLLSGEELAVKVYRANARQNPGALKAFQRDLAILRDHTHPNVVRIFDFGEIAGCFYVAMERIRGTPLSHHIGNRVDLSHGAAWEMLERLTDALSWLHSRGVVHGDIRTSNIVCTDGAIKLMDFGLQRDSRQVTVPAPDSPCPYASPERLLGRPLTPGSDLYSAAAVIYHLLAGEPPNAMASLPARVAAPVPRLRDRAPHIPDQLVGIIERCLHPDPALRPASAAEIAEECHVHLGEARPFKSQVARSVLADRMGEQPLDVSEVSALLLTICRVLSGIHDAGLDHPDLAPRNIRLSDGVDVEIESLPARPKGATLMMTEPKYAAPELLLTHITTDGAVHLLSDIYVLGFVSYEALAGRSALRRQLFEDPDEPETDLFWMKWHADPGTRLQPLSEVNPSVPQELSALIHRMIEKDPAARPGSLKDVECGLMQLQRRLQTTDDIDVALLASGAPISPAAKAGKPPRKILRRVWLLIFALGCSGAAWWLLKTGGRTSSILAESLLRAQWKVAWARERVNGLLRRTASPSVSSALPSAIETTNGPMVLVPAGRFVFGSNAVPNETPAHTVYLPAFYIDKYEVTNARYRAFTDTSGYSQPPAPSWDPNYFAKSLHPALNVSWRDAESFCIAAGKRLPTEAEWEKAARGSSPSSRLWANWTVDGLANLNRAGLTGPSPVGAFAADISPFGAYDMAGNVHEWVNDQYGLYTGNPAFLERENAKVVRGGSFALAPPELSPSWRASLDPSLKPGSDSPVGFRCAADPPPPKRN
jgi:formylglycine-generating enzyme required for sulfatase activity/serine/threonine protein kinase